MAETNINEKILNTRIVLKNDDLATWNSSSIILKKGEIALAAVSSATNGNYEVPTYLMKVGDGVSTFANLKWVAAAAADVYEWAKKENPTIEELPANLKTAIKNLQSAVGEGGSVADAIKAAVEALDVTDTVVEHQFVTAVSEVDGKISVTRAALTAADIPTLGIDKIDGLQAALNAKLATATFESYQTTNNATVLANTNAITAIKDGTTIDSFKDVEDALAGKQAAGDYVTTDEFTTFKNGNTEIINGIKDGTNINSFSAVETALAGKETAGAAAQALVDAKAYADGKDSAIAAAKKAGDDAQGTANTALANAATAQSEIDALELKVGNVPEGKTVMGIITNIQENAYDDSELRGLITGNANAIKAVADDYLKGADKTALEGSIALKADQTALDAEVERATKAEGALDERLVEVEAFFKTAESETLDTALDTLVEIQRYITGEGAAADQMVLDIAANAKAIEDEVKRATKAEEDLDGRIDVLEAKPAIGITTEDIGKWNGAVAKEHEHANKALLDTYDQTNANLKDAVAKKHEHSNKDVLDGISSTKVAAWDAAEVNAKAHAETKANEALEAAKTDASNKDAVVLSEAQAYANGIKTEALTAASTAETNAKTYAKNYADGLAGNYDAAGTAAGLIQTLDSEISASNGAVLTGVTITDGKLTAKTEQKISAIAVSGSTDDLVQGSKTLVFDCGTSSTVI